jgi:hypothetical protein
MDLISTYFPKITDIPPESLQEVRGRAKAWLRTGNPELDMDPDSPFGNLFLTPASQFLAATEIAVGRILSDLDPANAASGVIWNCDFVREFFKNFGVTDRSDGLASGAVRLEFSVDQAVTLDRRLQFSVNEDSVFFLKLPKDGGLMIGPTGSSLDSAATSNVLRLTQVAPGVYVCYVPVYGQMISQVTGGNTMELNTVIPNLTSAVAAFDFMGPAQTDSSLVAMAKRIPETFYAATLSNRGGISRWVRSEFPEVLCCSPVITGDREMLRGAVNAFGLSVGTVDVLVKSSGYLTSETVVFRADYHETQAGQQAEVFVAKLRLPSVAVRFTKFECPAYPEVSLGGAGGAEVTVFSTSATPSRLPMAAAAYSAAEEFWVVIRMPKDPANGNSLIVPSRDADGVAHAFFQLTYQSDPAVSAVAAFMETPEITTVGLDILVKGMTPIDLRSLTVKYTKTPGTLVAIEEARKNIYDYLRGIGGLPNEFSMSRVVEIMTAAGAQDVREVSALGAVRFTPAHRFLKSDGTPPDEDVVQATTDSVVAKNIAITGAWGFWPEYTDAWIGGPSQTLETVGRRNICYALNAEDIQFMEWR